MFIIGITGQTGAGKSIAVRALQDEGALALDCDDIYHELLDKNADMTGELKAYFANADITADGRIDTKKLAGIVFGNPDALSGLNSITHKYVLDDVERRITEFEKQGGSIVIISAIALIESGYNKRCNVVVCVTAPLETRISRLIKRDNLSRKDILTRINAQQYEQFYRNHSNYTLENTYDNEEEFISVCRRAFLIDKWFYDHEHKMISNLGELVAINSVRSKRENGAPFGQKPREALALAQKLLEEHGFGVNVFENMVITAQLGSSPAKLGILTHLDIVETGEHWDTDPLELIIKDGKLYGRGVMDNKGPAVASMYAMYCVRDLFPELKHGVQLIFGSSEETGFEDIARYMQCCEMPLNVFSPDADFPVVNLEKGRYMQSFGAIWEKDTTLPRIISITGGRTPNIVPNTAAAVIEGIELSGTAVYCEEFSAKTDVIITAGKGDNGTVTITAKGTAAHASRPHMGSNAQTALLGMLASMPFAKSKSFSYVQSLAHLFPHGDYYGNAISLAAEDELSGKTTVNFGVLRFDEYEFTAGFDARTAVCMDSLDLLDITRNVFGREGMILSYHELKKSHHTPEETEFVQILLRVYEQYTGRPGECICLGGLTYAHDIPGGVAFGCGMPGCEDDNNVHGANEYIDIKQLVMSAKMFVQVILEICGV